MSEKRPQPQPQDKFVLRLPDGMRDRIRAAAEASNRSMNAEIVATLEEKYPPPKPLYARDPNLNLNIGYLHWCPQADRWNPISTELWDLLRFQFLFKPGEDGSAFGDNHFAVVIFDDNGHVLNIISHMYRISEKGRVVGDIFDFMTEKERIEYRRIYTLQTPSPSEEAFIKRMQEKMRPYARPPSRALSLLRELLEKATSTPNFDGVFEKTGLASS